jgi:hypothetical protein
LAAGKMTPWAMPWFMKQAWHCWTGAQSETLCCMFTADASMPAWTYSSCSQHRRHPCMSWCWLGHCQSCSTRCCWPP